MPKARHIDPVGEAAPEPRVAAKPSLAMRPLHSLWRSTIDRIHVSEVALPVRALPPSLAGITACQISDFHVDREEDVARLVDAVEVINANRPDFVFLTGDYFSGPVTMARYAAEFTEVLRGLAPRLGVFAILGNHDHWASAERVTRSLKRAGAEVLTNANRRILIGGERLTIVGIDDLWSRRAEPARAFAGLDEDEPTVLLAHNPDTALYARHLKPGVMLSGHTHGGVVRIPYYGSPLKSILRIGKRFYSGLNQFEDFYIYTNRGLGTFWLRIRINCPPEVARLELRPIESHPVAIDAARARRKLNSFSAKPRRPRPRRKRKPAPIN
jgi:hypothetical protein